jgi:RNA polymerase sigma factor (TIGR02999 family)
MEEMYDDQNDEDITELLWAWRAGNESALDLLLPKVFEHLRWCARRLLARERVDHTLQPTALVHELLLRLMVKTPNCVNRKHFFNLAARMMKHMLTDLGRKRNADIHGGGLVRVSFETAERDATFDPNEELADLESALEQLAAVSSRQYQVVCLLYIAGLSVKETALALKIAESTIGRDHRAALAFLRYQLSQG